MRTLDLELIAYVVINTFIGVYGTFGTYMPFFIKPYNWRICPNGEYGKARCRPGFKFDCKRGYICIKQRMFSKFDGLLNGICCKAPSFCPPGQIQGLMCSFKGSCPLGYTCDRGVCCLATKSVCPPGTIPTSKCTKYYGCSYGAFCLHGTCCSIDKKASVCPLKHYPIPGIRCKHHLDCPDTSLCYGNTCCQSKFRLKRPQKKKTPPIFLKKITPFIPKQPTIQTRVVVKPPPKIIIPKPKILKQIIQRPVVPPHVKITMCPIGYKKVLGLTCSHITACPGTSECISGLCCSKSVKEICPLDHRVIPEVNCNLRQRCPIGSKCISGVCCHPPSCPGGSVLVSHQSCEKGTCSGNNVCISGSCCRPVTPPPPTLITDPPLLFDLPKIPPVRAVRKPVLSTKAPIRLTMPPLPNIVKTVPTPRVPPVDLQTLPSRSIPVNNPTISKAVPSIPSSFGTTSSSFLPPSVPRFPEIVDILLRNITVTNPSITVNTIQPISIVGIQTGPTQIPNFGPVFPSQRPNLNVGTSSNPLLDINVVPNQALIPTNVNIGIPSRPSDRPITLPILPSKRPSFNVRTTPVNPPLNPNFIPSQPPQTPNVGVGRPNIPLAIPNVRPLLPTKRPIYSTVRPKQPVPTFDVTPAPTFNQPISNVGVPNNPIPNPNAVPILSPVDITPPLLDPNPFPNLPARSGPPIRETPSPFIPPTVTRLPDIIDILLKNLSVTNPPTRVNNQPPISNINVPIDPIPNPNAVPILPVDVTVPSLITNVLQNNAIGSIDNNSPPARPNVQVNVIDRQIPQTSIEVQPLIPQAPIQPGLVQIPSLTDVVLNPSKETLIPGAVPAIPNLSTNITSGLPIIPDLNLPTFPPILTNVPLEPILPLDPILPPTDIQIPQLTIPTQQPVLPTFPSLPSVTMSNLLNLTPLPPDLPGFTNSNTTVPTPTLFTAPPVLPFEPIGNLSTNTILPPIQTVFPLFPPAAPTTPLSILTFSKTTTATGSIFPPKQPIDTIPSILPPIFPPLTPIAGLIPSNISAIPNSTLSPQSVFNITDIRRTTSRQNIVINPIPTTLPTIVVPKVSVTVPPTLGIPPIPAITIPSSLPNIPSPPTIKQPPLGNTTIPLVRDIPVPPIIPNPIPTDPLPPVINNIIPRPPPTIDPPPPPIQPIILPPPPSIDIQTMPPLLTDPMNVPIAPIDIPPPPATISLNNFMPTNSPPIPSPPPLIFVNDTVSISTLPPSLFVPTVPSFNFTLPPLNPLAPIIPPYSAPPAIPAATLAPIIPPAVPSPAGPTFPPFIAILNTSTFTTTAAAPFSNITNPNVGKNATPAIIQVVDNPKLSTPFIDLTPFNFTIPPLDVLNTTSFINQQTFPSNVTYPSLGPDLTTPYVPFIDPFNFTIPPSNNSLVINSTLPPLNVTYKRVNIPPVNFTDPPLNVTPPIFNDTIYFENYSFPFDNISFSENTSFPWINFTLFDINTTTTTATHLINPSGTTKHSIRNTTFNISTPISSFTTKGPFDPPFLETNTTLPPTLWVTLTPKNYSKTPAPYPTNSTDNIPFSSTSKYMFNFTYPPEAETVTSTGVETFGNTTMDTPFVTVPSLGPPTKTVPPFIPTSCPAGNITIPGLSCDKVFRCPAGSSCYYGFCCLPYEMVQVPACLVDFVVTDVCPNPPETDQCRYDRDCGPFMTCCLNSCDRRVCRPTVNPKPSKPR